MSFPAASPGALHQKMPGLQFKCKFSCMDKDLVLGHADGLKAALIHKNKSGV